MHVEDPFKNPKTPRCDWRAVFSVSLIGTADREHRARRFVRRQFFSGESLRGIERPVCLVLGTSASEAYKHGP